MGKSVGCSNRVAPMEHDCARGGSLGTVSSDQVDNILLVNTCCF